LQEVEEVLCKFDEYKTMIEANKNVLDKVDALKAELAEFEEVYEEVERQFNIESTNVTKYTAQLDQIRKDVAENKSIDNSLKIYDIYRKSLKSLPYILLSKVQPVLEKKVNDLLSIITDFTVKFDMSDNKIDIYIDRPVYRTENRYILVNNGSGFERFVASLAIRIALLDMSNLPKINFMAIDEGWSSFDTHNINNVGIILDYLKTKFDFILTISHLIQIKEHCDVIIGLKKNEKGFSQIVKS
jgi:DNA repair exonuclease SbcCD ATPase subunit